MCKMQCVNGSASRTSWTDQLDEPAGRTSWMDQLDGPAGRTSWTDQFFLFEALACSHIWRFSFQFVRCRSFRFQRRPCFDSLEKYAYRPPPQSIILQYLQNCNIFFWTFLRASTKCMYVCKQLILTHARITLEAELHRIVILTEYRIPNIFVHEEFPNTEYRIVFVHENFSNTEYRIYSFMKNLQIPNSIRSWRIFKYWITNIFVREEFPNTE